MQRNGHACGQPARGRARKQSAVDGDASRVQSDAIGRILTKDECGSRRDDDASEWTRAARQQHLNAHRDNHVLATSWNKAACP